MIARAIAIVIVAVAARDGGPLATALGFAVAGVQLLLVDGQGRLPGWAHRRAAALEGALELVRDQRDHWRAVATAGRSARGVTADRALRLPGVWPVSTVDGGVLWVKPWPDPAPVAVSPMQSIDFALDDDPAGAGTEADEGTSAVAEIPIRHPAVVDGGYDTFWDRR